MITAREFKLISKSKNGYIVKTDGPSIQIVFLTDDIIRVRGSFNHEFEEASYSLSLTAWDDEFDELLKDYRTRVESLAIDYKETDEYIVFETETLILQMLKKPFGFRLFNKEKKLIYSDLIGRNFVQDHLGRVFHYNQYKPKSDHFYGFGERAGHLDKKEKRMRLTPKDAIGQDPEFADPMYKHIPFYIRMNEETKHSLGFFYHNSYDSVFDMGNEISGYYDRYSYYSAESGNIDWFIVNGPTVKDVLNNYTKLTGRQAMPPKHSLGFTMSTMYYGELEHHIDEEVYKVMDKHLEEGIHIDNFKMPSGYTTGIGNQKRFVFNWNKEKFPNPQQFFDTMKEKGIGLIPNIKPGILLNHPLMEEFVANDVFVRTADETEYYEGPWWGGLGRYFDFTNPRARITWKKHLKEQLIEKGTNAVWNDNCEYDGVEDRKAVFDYEGKKGTGDFLRVHQGNLMAHIAMEAVEESHPGQRAYVINRAGFAGIQKYAQTWCGDNLTEWRTPKFNIASIIGMGLSGVANTGCDVGGFTGPAPEAELLLRWIQNGIFQPRFCINSANTDNKVTEPWMYQRYKNQVKEAYDLRYRLIAYLYSQMYNANQLGQPIMQPLFYEFEKDLECLKDQSMSFMLGGNVLVANVLEKGATTRKLYLPKGADWYHFNDYMTHYEGGQWIEIPVDKGSIPMFIRSNGCFYLNNQITNISKDVIDHLDLYIGGEVKDEVIYEDDGVTNDYKSGDYCKTIVNVEDQALRKIAITKEGDYESEITSFVIHSLHPDKSAYWVTHNHEPIKRYLQIEEWEKAKEGWCYFGDENAVLVKIQNTLENHEIIVSYEDFDLIGMDAPLTDQL